MRFGGMADGTWFRFAGGERLNRKIADGVYTPLGAGGRFFGPFSALVVPVEGRW